SNFLCVERDTCYRRFLFSPPSSPAIYPLSLHDALPIFGGADADPAGAAEGLAQLDGRRADPAGAGMDQGFLTRLQASQLEQVERSEEHTSELQSRENLVCRLLLEKKKKLTRIHYEQTLY